MKEAEVSNGHVWLVEAMVVNEGLKGIGKKLYEARVAESEIRDGLKQQREELLDIENRILIEKDEQIQEGKNKEAREVIARKLQKEDIDYRTKQGTIQQLEADLQKKNDDTSTIEDQIKILRGQTQVIAAALIYLGGRDEQR